jgi:hypothetical protein
MKDKLNGGAVVGSSTVLGHIVEALGKDLAERHGYDRVIKKTSDATWRMMMDDWKRIIVEVTAAELLAASKLKSISKVERPRIPSARQSVWRLPGGRTISLLRRRRASPHRKVCNAPDQSPTSLA